jgi:hypothetical protein
LERLGVSRTGRMRESLKQVLQGSALSHRAGQLAPRVSSGLEDAAAAIERLVSRVENRSSAEAR